MSSRGQGNGIHRRTFLGLAGLAALPHGPDWVNSLLPGRSAKLGKIGIQLYTVREELARNVEGTLARLAVIGFKEVEFAGYPDGTAQSLRKILNRHGLQAISSHVDIQRLRADWERTLDQAVMVGQHFIVVPSVPAEETRTVDDWKRIAGVFNKAGEAARAKGIQFGYHNHDSEFTSVEGRLPFDLLLEETDPRLVQFEMDLYWITKGGQDPLAYFDKWPGRFPLVHVKDMDATPPHSFTAVGKGTIDFGRIFGKAKQAGIRHYFFEQDETPGSPFEAAQTSYDYLRALRY